MTGTSGDPLRELENVLNKAIAIEGGNRKSTPAGVVEGESDEVPEVKDKKKYQQLAELRQEVDVLKSSVDQQRTSRVTRKQFSELKQEHESLKQSYDTINATVGELQCKLAEALEQLASKRKPLLEIDDQEESFRAPRVNTEATTGGVWKEIEALHRTITAYKQLVEDNIGRIQISEVCSKIVETAAKCERALLDIEYIPSGDAQGIKRSKEFKMVRAWACLYDYFETQDFQQMNHRGVKALIKLATCPTIQEKKDPCKAFFMSFFYRCFNREKTYFVYFDGNKKRPRDEEEGELRYPPGFDRNNQNNRFNNNRFRKPRF